VLGGSGYVGSHVCEEALRRGATVTSVSRSGAPKHTFPWSSQVAWTQCSLDDEAKLGGVLANATGVVSCVGKLGGSQESMLHTAGTLNAIAARVALNSGVQRFVYVSAFDYAEHRALPKFITDGWLQGYFAGKKIGEAAVQELYNGVKPAPVASASSVSSASSSSSPSAPVAAFRGVILRPTFVFGTRRTGDKGQFPLPLGVVGLPMQLLLNSNLMQHTVRSATNCSHVTHSCLLLLLFCCC
jgi:nucleoside-diphosphate-sugar epimerase